MMKAILLFILLCLTLGGKAPNHDHYKKLAHLDYGRFRSAKTCCGVEGLSAIALVIVAFMI